MPEWISKHDDLDLYFDSILLLLWDSAGQPLTDKVAVHHGLYWKATYGCRQKLAKESLIFKQTKAVSNDKNQNTSAIRILK